jgi:methyl-accepting chemotaxis protein
VQMLRRHEKDMLLNAATPEKVVEYKKKWDESRKRIDELLPQASATATTDEERRRIDELTRSIHKYALAMEQVETAVVDGRIKTPEAGYRKVDEFRELVRGTEAITQELFDGANKRIDAVKPALAAGEHDRQAVILVGVLLGLAAALTISVLIARSITRPVREAMRVAEALAQGDLTVVVGATSNDEIGRLMKALGGTVTQLGRIVGRIKDTSDRVNAASREIAQANIDLSTRTEEQASALEESSASMQQMSATVGQNAQNARTANDLAVQASGVATRGGEVVRTAVGTMKEITDASKRIADITGVIDGIAFQTNILALNAAVEAARAGEQGRGFAVVASEVRSLAQRSAGAAKEIKDLISNSAARVETGSRQVDEAGRAMEEIVASVKQVSGLIAEISKASQEQALGIGQVTEAMTQLEQVTQQNAAMVEEASAAAATLEDQAGSMSTAVGAFQLEAQPASPSAHTPLAAAVAALRPVAEPQRPQGAVRPAAALRAPARKLAGKPSLAVDGEAKDWTEF